MFVHLVNMWTCVNVSLTDLYLPKLLSKDKIARDMKFYMLFIMQTVHTYAESCFLEHLEQL